MAKRVKTGITGLDRMIEGGLPENSCVLISGGPGTGKTLIGLQFIHHGAMNGEPGIYITFEENEANLRTEAEKIGLDFGQLKGKAAIVRLKLNDIDRMMAEITKLASQMKAKRLVIDSLTTLTVFASTYRSVLKELPLGWSQSMGARIPVTLFPETLVRKTLYNVIDNLKSMDLTTLLVSETSDGASKYNIAEFVSDGIIHLGHIPSGGGAERTLSVEKMRETVIDDAIRPISITNKGVIVQGSK